MNNVRYWFIALLLASLYGCHTPDKPGSGLFFFNTKTNDNGEPDSVLTPSSFLELRPDGNYTQDFGHFYYGSWMIKDNRLYLTNQRHRTYIYLIRFRTPKGFGMMLDKEVIGIFTAHPMPSSNPEKDPFSTYNNQWRIPAAHKETSAEIRKRLYNHLQFWEAYFTWAQENESGEIQVASIPTPLKIYGNGFGLKRYSDLPAAWTSYFYDSTDCHTADTLIKHTFRRHDIVWPKTDNDLKKLISGTHQVREWLK